jgi:ATPase subunit of ABC transporter with duplicated ATPase domains
VGYPAFDVRRGNLLNNNPVTKAESLSIESERQGIFEQLRSGDLDNLRAACERLSALAENHYSDRFLSTVITLIARANRLIDQVRARTMTIETQNADSNQIILDAVQILTEIKKVDPTGQISAANHNDPEISRKLISLAEAEHKEPQGNLDRSRGSQEDDLGDRELLNLIVCARDPQERGTLIIAENISKNYLSTNFNLREINLTLHRGEILGVVGVNASGKTTLLRILIGDLKQSTGVLRYPTLEHGIEGRNWEHIKRRIAYVSQTLPAWPGRVFDNLRYVASLYGHPRLSIDPFLNKLLQRYGLDKFKDATWDEISGGYRTRFELVRALVSNPDILLLDEPLAYLDRVN